jgi:hypothetical protein
MENYFSRIARVKGIFLFIALLSLILSSCNQQQNEQRQKKIDDLKAYVQQYRDSLDYYANANWDSLNNDFEMKKAELEKDTAKFDDNMRQEYYNTVNDWDSFKNQYSVKKEENGRLAQMDALRKSLTIDGVRTDYADLTAANIVDEYQHFVNTVSANKDTYTKEQWTIVNVTWKGLKGRNREIQKDISSGDGAKILKLQLQYTGIKALNRPEADNS